MSTVMLIVGFLLWVNFLPPLAHLIWGQHFFSRPVDGNQLWFDQRPVFGPNKTIRGVMMGLAGGSAAFPILGVTWWQAGLAAILVTTGDLLSSFIKRRCSMSSGKTVVVLDQLFESLFPTFYLATILQLTFGQILFVLLCFIPVAFGGSFFWNYITYRPPIENYPRLIRSTVRFREWRSCHTPLARWQTLLNLTSFLSNQVFLTSFFKLTGLHEKGVENTLNVQVEERTFSFPELPDTFNGFQILLLTDLHLDGLDNLTDELIRRVRDLKVDLCLIGGDIRMETYGPMASCLRHLRRLLPHIQSRHGILGVLGNHDCIEMTPDLEETGMVMLINDSWNIDQDGERIWVVGVDDPHYYKLDDAKRACQDVPGNDFIVFLAHSPEAYKSAAENQAKLYLCGHTHGGQICLPNRGPILTNSRAPRSTAAGQWRYLGMAGYTSRGAGASSVPLRFNCPGEIALITLRKEVEK